MSIKSISLCFYWGFSLSFFKFCHRLCCYWGKREVLLQSWIHRNTMRKVGAAPPPPPSLLPRLTGRGGLLWQAVAGTLAVSGALLD